jgi:NADH-quinone oxidoreductase subunit A
MIKSAYILFLLFQVYLFFIGLSLLSTIFYDIPVKSYNTLDKTSAYECGFEASGDARNSFDVKFYLVGILFLIFDLELIFVFPWVIALQKINLIGFYSMALFLTILTIGFVYEWKRGALDW